MRDLVERLEYKLEKIKRKEKTRNIIIRGANFKWNDREKEIEDFLRNKLEVNIKVEKAVRLKEGNNNTLSWVLATLVSNEAKKEVMRKKGKLKGSKIYVDDDFTRSERKSQNGISEVAKEMRKELFR